MKAIEVITGCMFAGKTTELLSRLRSTNHKYLLVKPKIDDRETGDTVATHNGLFEKAIRVNKLSDLFKVLKNIKVIGIDEAQFFTKSIIEDLILDAHTRAKSQLKSKTTEEISKATGGFGIPGFKWPL